MRVERADEVRRGRALPVQVGAVALVAAALAVWVPGEVLARMAQLDGVVLAPATTGAAIGYYVAWRLRPTPALGWFAAAMIVLGMQAMGVTALQVAGGDTGLEPAGTAMAWDLVVALMVATCGAVSTRWDLRGDPAVAGLVLGGGLVAARLALSGLGLAVGTGTAARITLAVLILACDAMVLAAFLRRDRRAWLERRIAFALLTFSLGHLARSLGGDREPAALAAVVLVGLCAGTVVVSAWQLVVRVLGAQQQRVEWLSTQVMELRGDARTERARMHELRSTLAGVSSAAHLINTAAINDRRRAQLEDMMDSELGRLQRLVADRLVAAPADPARVVDLDAVLSRLVVAHGARGHAVAWRPVGALAIGDADRVTEVVNILLDNAARHGGGGTDLEVRHLGEAVEVAVRDDGPGVPAELRERLFDWGISGPSSSGQGIGLWVGRTLAEQQPDGSLELRESGAGGEFVLTLRAARRTRSVPFPAARPEDPPVSDDRPSARAS